MSTGAGVDETAAGIGVGTGEVAIGVPDGNWEVGVAAATGVTAGEAAALGVPNA